MYRVTVLGVYVLVSGCFGIANEKSKTNFLGDSGDMDSEVDVMEENWKIGGRGGNLVLVKMESLYLLGWFSNYQYCIFWIF